MSGEVEYENRSEKISASLPISFLEIVEDHCDRHGYSRSGFIKKALENQLLSELNKKPIWEYLYKQMMA